MPHHPLRPKACKTDIVRKEKKAQSPCEEKTMHLKTINFHPEKYPRQDIYPFNLEIFQKKATLAIRKAVTFFVGENGTGKSTLLRAIARRAGIHIWEGEKRRRYHYNQHEETLYKYISTTWNDGPVPGSFFASELFHNFAAMTDEWAEADPGSLEYLGGKSLVARSHGQSHMAFFESRLKIKGLYLLDEPENALSPHRQIELLQLLQKYAKGGIAQFIVATHSPILMALPGAEIISFTGPTLEMTPYEKTDHFTLYRDFLNNRGKFI